MPVRSATLTVQFDPTVAGAATGQVTISSNSTTGSTTTVALSGTGAAASHEVDLYWNAPSTSPDPVAGYRVYRATGTGSYSMLNGSLILADNVYRYRCSERHDVQLHDQERRCQRGGERRVQHHLGDCAVIGAVSGSQTTARILRKHPQYARFFVRKSGHLRRQNAHKNARNASFLTLERTISGHLSGQNHASPIIPGATLSKAQWGSFLLISSYPLPPSSCTRLRTALQKLSRFSEAAKGRMLCLAGQSNT